MSQCNWCGDNYESSLWTTHLCIEPKERDADFPTAI